MSEMIVLDSGTVSLFALTSDLTNQKQEPKISDCETSWLVQSLTGNYESSCSHFVQYHASDLTTADQVKLESLFQIVKFICPHADNNVVQHAI